MQNYRLQSYPILHTVAWCWCGISTAQATQGNWRGSTKEDSVQYSVIGSLPVVISFHARDDQFVQQKITRYRNLSKGTVQGMVIAVK